MAPQTPAVVMDKYAIFSCPCVSIADLNLLSGTGYSKLGPSYELSLALTITELQADMFPRIRR